MEEGQVFIASAKGRNGTGGVTGEKRIPPVILKAYECRRKGEDNKEAMEEEEEEEEEAKRRRTAKGSGEEAAKRQPSREGVRQLLAFLEELVLFSS